MCVCVTGNCYNGIVIITLNNHFKHLMCLLVSCVISANAILYGLHAHYAMVHGTACYMSLLYTLQWFLIEIFIL